ncbi:hypothetical protein PF008_g26434 [Phytophthora fragariae]|uniref:RxLR effector protein n=1 Tax=Phytophthora fragariae TaxID=53985 RepID=A0A6G0QHP3_9STRA|nr:hypothetical protein PF008_g26434 [Phytophthora fragariae]
MKTSSSILAAIAMLAVAALSATGVYADEIPVSDDAHTSNHLVTSEPVVSEKTWMPFRALRAMDYPQLGHLDYTHKPIKPTSLDNLTIIKNAHRALSQAQVAPAPSTSTTRATPTPTRMNTPKVTPAATTTKATPSSHKGASPSANKYPKAAVAPPTKQGKTGKTGVSTNSNAAQQKSRNLGGDEAKHQFPHDHHHDAKQNSKNGLKHQ